MPAGFGRQNLDIISRIDTYADEITAVGLSVMLKRPVKFIADRLESFTSDIHARDHRVKGKIAIKADGTITAFEIDDLTVEEEEELLKYLAFLRSRKPSS